MEKKFSIKINDEVFYSNEEGMLNLNEIRKGLDLPTKYAPSQWRSKVKDYLSETGNLHAGKLTG